MARVINMNNKCIVIFANDPDNSDDLKEFYPIFGKKNSAYLSRAMLFDTLAMCLSLPRTDVIVAYYPAKTKANYERMLDVFKHEEFDNKLQKKADTINSVPQNGNRIMKRISNVFDEAFKKGYKQVEMIGAYGLATDHHLLKAGYLLLDENDFVIGPSFSGRYYLFGMSRFMPDVFDGVTWESKDFYVKINENIQNIGASVQELEISYEVYTPDELNQLMLDIERWRSLGDERTAYHTERCLRAIQQ